MLKRYNSVFLATIIYGLIFFPGIAMAQLDGESFKPLKLTKEQVKQYRVKSVMGMLQLNLEGMSEGEDYLPRQEDYESYERYKKDDFRKLFFFTSLGTYIAYDEAGNISAEANLSKKEITQYRYDSQGNMTELRQVELNYPTSSDTEILVRYEYDKEGKMIGYFNGATQTTLIRNKNGEVTSWKVEEIPYEAAELREKANDKSDKSKKEINKPIRKDLSSQYKYDSEGRLLSHNGGGYRDVYEYTSNPKQTISFMYQGEELKDKRISEFDNKNRVIKQQLFKPRSGKLALFSTITYTYDEAGNIKTYNSKNEIEPALGGEMKFTFSYSPTGLPLKREIYQNGKLLGTEIFYYEHF